MRGTQDETSQRVARNDFEDFMRLLRGERGVLPEQRGRMRERNIKRAQGFREAIQSHIPRVSNKCYVFIRC